MLAALAGGAPPRLRSDGVAATPAQRTQAVVKER